MMKLQKYWILLLTASLAFAENIVSQQNPFQPRTRQIERLSEQIDTVLESRTSLDRGDQLRTLLTEVDNTLDSIESELTHHPLPIAGYSHAWTTGRNNLLTQAQNLSVKNRRIREVITAAQHLRKLSQDWTQPKNEHELIHIMKQYVHTYQQVNTPLLHTLLTPDFLSFRSFNALKKMYNKVLNFNYSISYFTYRKNYLDLLAKETAIMDPTTLGIHIFQTVKSWQDLLDNVPIGRKEWMEYFFYQKPLLQGPDPFQRIMDILWQKSKNLKGRVLSLARVPTPKFDITHVVQNVSTITKKTISNIGGLKFFSIENQHDVMGMKIIPPEGVVSYLSCPTDLFRVKSDPNLIPAYFRLVFQLQSPHFDGADFHETLIPIPTAKTFNSSEGMNLQNVPPLCDHVIIKINNDNRETNAQDFLKKHFKKIFNKNMNPRLKQKITTDSLFLRVKGNTPPSDLFKDCTTIAGITTLNWVESSSLDIAPNFRCLPNLKAFLFSGSNSTNLAHVPTTLGTLSKLKKIYINHGLLSSAVVAQLASMPSLQHVHIENSVIHLEEGQSLGLIQALRERLQLFPQGSSEQFFLSLPKTVVKVGTNTVLPYNPTLEAEEENYRQRIKIIRSQLGSHENLSY